MSWLGPIGTPPIGAHSLAGSLVRSSPEATVTAPTTTLSTGGPSITVTWTYSQAESLPQEQAKVQITNGTGTVTHFDSGWVYTSDQFMVVDLVAEGVPTDTTDLAVVVGVRAELDRFPTLSPQGFSAAQAFGAQWGVVTLEVTFPSEGIVIPAADAITATWTFASTRSKTQGGYRVRLLAASTGAVLFDSLWQAGTASSYEISWPLARGGTYQVGVSVRNNEGVLASG